jgi:ribosomal protein S18 acetylase RimI-like enzyme
VTHSAAGLPVVTVRQVAPGDEAAWRELYRGYRDFYHVAPDDSAIDTVWSWLHDPSHETRGFVACVDGVPHGIAHFRSFARPLSASRGLFLDDLFTAQAARGAGLGSALLGRLAETARDEGATVVRWITAEDNWAARSLYNAVSKQTPWVTYDLGPAS